MTISEHETEILVDEMTCRPIAVEEVNRWLEYSTGDASLKVVDMFLGDFTILYDENAEPF